VDAIGRAKTAKPAQAGGFRAAELESLGQMRLETVSFQIR
jgi:hypothetical protein